MNRLTLSIFFALLSGAMMGLRVGILGEFWLDRTYALLVISMIGGMGGAMIPLVLVPRFPRPIAVLPRSILYAFAFASCFMVTMGLAYVVHHMWIAQAWEPHPDRPIASFFGSSLQIFSLFLFSSPTYLMPWLLPCLMVFAGYLLTKADHRMVDVEQRPRGV